MDKSKIILIVGAVFIVIALALSTVSVIMLSSVLKQVKGEADAATEEEGEMPVIPLSETSSYELSSPVVAVVKSDTEAKTMNKSIEIGFLLNNENKKTPEVLELMANKEGVIRDRISKLIETKSVEDFESNNFTEKLQKEILDLISAELDTDTIVEVYFINNLGTTR